MSNNLERTILEVAAALFLIWGTVAYLEHRGAAECKQADKAAVAKQEDHDQAKAASDTQTINIEAKTYAQTLASPDPIDSPHVSLCKYTPASAVPSPATPGSVAHEAAPSRAADPVYPATDVGPPLVKVGVDSDAQVKGLQDYIQRVCLVR